MDNTVEITVLGLTFTVSVDDWNRAHSIGSKKAVQADIKEYFRNALLGLQIWDEVDHAVTRK